MNFSNFLNRLKKDLNLLSTEDLFKNLGGEKNLEVGYRTFQQIYSGRLPPTLKFFNKIFNKLDGGILKEAFQSFLESSLSPNESKRIKSFVKNSMPIVSVNESQGLFDASKDKTTLTETQLKFLIQNRDALRLFDKLILDDIIPYSELKKNEQLNKVAKELEKHNLAKRRADGALVSIAEIVMLPGRERGSRAAYKMANKYILEHIDAYLTDDKENERICYSLQYVPTTVYKTLLDETEAHKKRVHKLASLNEELKKDPKREHHVPILLVSYIKKIEKDEI